MEHKTREEIRDVADILPSCLQARPLSKLERLELWVEALEREGGRRLSTLFEIEYALPTDRAGLRADDSPLSVASPIPGYVPMASPVTRWVMLLASSASASWSCTISCASVTTARLCRPKQRPREFAPWRQARQDIGGDMVRGTSLAPCWQRLAYSRSEPEQLTKVPVLAA